MACVADIHDVRPALGCEDGDIQPELCAALEANLQGDDDKGASELRGIVVERSGSRTYFKIPMAYTHEPERERLMEETIDRFAEEIEEINRDLYVRGIDTGALDRSARQTLRENYIEAMSGLLGNSIEDELEERLGEDYAEPRELQTWQRYLVPQAYIFYFGTKFSVNTGLGGGGSATIMIVAQPWLVVGVDHTLAQPEVVEKRHEIDVAVMGVPNVDVGVGAGGGAPLRIGIGAIWGPLDDPSTLSGVGAGLSGSFSLPFVGGGSAKAVVLFRRPPLFLTLLGYSTGTAAGAEVHGNIQLLLNWQGLLQWADSFTGRGNQAAQ